MNNDQWITNFKDNTGRWPTVFEVSKGLNISHQAATNHLTRILREGEVKPSESDSFVRTPVKFSFSPVRALKVGLFIVSGFTFILSIYFTSLWFRSMFSPWIAGLISVSMVTYMVLSPQVGRFIKGTIKLPLWASFIIALMFSMGSTIAGQYEKLNESVDVVVTSDRTMYELLEKEEADLESKITGYEAEKAFHMETMRNLGNTEEKRKENYGYIATERNKVEEYNELIKETEERLYEVRQTLKEEISNGSSGVVEEAEDFFTWIAGIIEADRTLVQFWIYTLPAIFIDVIAALCLNLALFIKEK